MTFDAKTKKPIIVGGTKFKPITSRQRKLVDKNMKYFRDEHEKEWAIDYGKFDKFQWKQTFQIIQFTHILNLWLNDNKSKYVLSCLSTPIFNNMLILNLNSNQIQNLQAICFLQAPNLQRIEFNDNQIADIKSFRKTNFDSLTWLSFCNNPVTDWSTLSEIYAPQLQRLDIRRKPFPLLDESVSWVLKMESEVLRRVDALTFRRIGQEEIRQMIHERYKEMQLEWSVI